MARTSASDFDRILEEKLNSPPTATTTGRAPIGVPEGYTAGKQPTVGYGDTLPENPEGQGLRSPRYFEGAELRPANWTPDQIADLQKKMAEAGLLKGKFRLGYWDGASQKAYTALLSYANQSGRTATASLDELRTHPEQGDDGEGRPPLATKTTSPDDLRNTFRDVTRKLTGFQLPDEELAKYISAYNQVELERQRQEYAITDPEGQGGNVVTIPDPSAYIEERMRKERPVDVGSHEIASRANEFYDLLGSFGGD